MIDTLGHYLKQERGSFTLIHIQLPYHPAFSLSVFRLVSSGVNSEQLTNLPDILMLTKSTLCQNIFIWKSLVNNFIDLSFCWRVTLYAAMAKTKPLKYKNYIAKYPRWGVNYGLNEASIIYIWFTYIMIHWYRLWNSQRGPKCGLVL